jgi:hypothetical protein
MTAKNNTENTKDSSAVSVESTDLLASLTAHVREDCVILQKSPYIEDGWFIKVIPSQIQLWEISQYGGEAQFYASFPTITAAYKHAVSLG